MLKLVSLVLIILCSCHCEKQTAEKKPAVVSKIQAIPADTVQSLNNLVVSFYSKGNGINREAARQVEDFITMYSQKSHIDIPYKKTGWGREGEMDFCISLAAMNKVQKDKFIAEVGEIIRFAETVHLYENHPCREIK